MNINILAVLVSSIIFFAIGAGWYGIFSKQWLAALEKTEEFTKEEPKNMPTKWFPYPASFVMFFILNLVLAHFISELGIDQAADGALLGLLLWLGFTATTSIVHAVYEDKKWSLFLINGGYTLIGTVVSGIILALWR